MPKIVGNPRRNELSIDGLVNKHDAWLNQPVLTTSNVTFNDMHLTGDVVVDGNMTVQGSRTIMDVDILVVKDNLIEVNKDNQTPLGVGGLVVNRGPSLQPYYMIYDEELGGQRIGTSGNLQAVATRPDTGLNQGIATFDNTTKQFIPVDEIKVPITFDYQSSFLQGVRLGSGVSNPTITANPTGTLTTTATNVIFDLTNPTGSIQFPVDKQVQFGSQVALEGDSLGRLLLSGSELRLTPQSKIQWGDFAFMTTTSDGNTIRLNAMRIDLAAAMDVTIAVPLKFSTIGSISSETGNVLKVSSTGDILLDAAGVVEVPSLSFADGKVRMTSDAIGNFTIEADGDITLSPAVNVYIPASKRLSFGTADKNVRVNANNLEISSGTKLVMNAIEDIWMNSPVHFGATSSIQQTGSDLIISSTAGAIILQPVATSSQVQIPTDTPLQFGNNEKISSNGQHMYIESGTDIVLSPTRHVLLSGNKAITFSSEDHKIYHSSSGNLNIASTTEIVMEGAVTLTGILQWASNSLNEIGGNLIVNSTGLVQVNSNAFRIQSSSGGSSYATAALATAGSAYVGKQITIAESASIGTSLAAASNSFQVDDNTIGNPVVNLRNRSNTQGVAIGLTGTFDTTTGYTIGRGTNNVNGGRALAFTLPTYTDYSSAGSRPAFYFGSRNDTWILTVADNETALERGTFRIASTSNSALQVTGGGQFGSITTASSTVTGVMTADNTSGVNTTMLLKASAGLQVRHSVTDQLLVDITDNNATFQTFTAQGASEFQSTLNVVGQLSANASSFTGNMSLGGNRIIGVASPVDDNDVATKSYVQQISQGLSHKVSAIAGTTAQINLAAQHFMIDDVVLTPTDRVLVKDQADPKENGIYVVQANNTLARASDFDVNDSVAGSALFVSEGTVWGGTGFVLTGADIIVGTNDIIWTAYTGASLITAGTGLSKTGNQIDVNIDNSSIETSPGNALRISSTALGAGLSGGSGIVLTTASDQSHVTKIGTVTTGVWNASAVQVGYGGTGLTSVPEGRLLIGGSGTSLQHSTLHYDTVNRRLGVGTIVPSSTLEVKENTTPVYINVVSGNEGTPQSAGLLLKQSGRQSQMTMAETGTLYISQDDVGSHSQIELATGGGNTRMTINNSGQVMMNTGTPDGTHTLTVGGDVSLDNLKTTGAVQLGGYATLEERAGAPSDLLLTTSRLYVSSGFEATTDSAVGNLEFLTTATHNIIQSRNKSTTLGIPLHLRQTPSITSATCFNGGFHVPNAFHVGGTYDDTTTSYKVALVGNEFQWTPGTSSMSVVHGGKVRFSKQVSYYDSTTPANIINTIVSGNALNVTAGATQMNYNIGVGGTSEIITTIGNVAGNKYIRFDPTVGGNGLFTVSGDTDTRVMGQLTYYKAIVDDTSKGSMGSLGMAGWYYLGTLPSGETTISASTAWVARIDYDGVSSYTVDLLMYKRNVANLVIYKSGGVNYIFVYIYTAPVQIHVYETLAVLSLSQYEGASAANPDGTYSNYTGSWVKDYDSQTAQGTMNAELGSVTATGACTVNSLSVTGASTMSGGLNVVGNSTFEGTSFTWSSATGNIASITKDLTINDITVHAPATSSAVLNLDRDTVQARLSLNASTAGQYPGSLVISHPTLSTDSQIVLATRDTARVVVNDTGKVIVLSTQDTTGNADGAMVISGGLQVNKKIHALSSTTTPELILKNTPGGTTVSLTCTSGGNVDIGGRRMTNGAAPVDANDYVTKEYADMLLQGASAKEGAYAASAGSDVDLSSPVTLLDGVVIPVGSRILLKDQSNAVENGIYVTQSGAPPTRAPDMLNGSDAAAAFVFVSEGTVNALTGWLCNTPQGSDVVGVNAITFVQFNAAGLLTVGPGLTKTGNQINLSPDNNSLEIVTNVLRIKSTALGTGLSGGSGQPISVSSIAHLDTLGIITQGQWQGSVVGLAYGGTGASAFSANRIPFSNGLQLTQGDLVFDADNTRLGVNTLTPTEGITLQDRNIQLTQTAAAQSHLIFTSATSNYSFAIRQSGNQLVWSSGTGNDKTALTDRMYIDSGGSLWQNYGIVSPSVTLGSAYRYSGNTIERTTSGALQVSLFSADNTGAYTTYYGGLGTVGSTANSEFMRVGFYNSAYTVSTSATGTGVVRNLVMQTGLNTGQLTLKTTGVVEANAPVSITNVTDATSITSGGALTVAGGAAINGKLYTQQAILSGEVSLEGTYTYQVLASQTANSLHMRNVTTSSAFHLHMYNVDANNSADAKLRLFGTGTETSDAAAEWVELGYNFATTSYTLLTKHNSGTLRSLTLGAAIGQQTFSASGIELTAPLTAQTTDDAVSSSNGGAVTIKGGLAVAKTAYVGTRLLAPKLNVSDTLEYTDNNSVDTLFVKYKSTGNLHYYNTSGTKLYVHTGVSGGPGAANQEYLSWGYLDAARHVIESNGSGTGVVRDLVLKVGTNTDQLRLTASGTVMTAGILNVTNTTAATSTTSGSLQIGGGAGIAGAVYVGGKVEVGSGSLNGTIMKMTGVAGSWSFASDSVNSRTALKAGAGTDVLAVTDSSDNVLVLVDQVNGLTRVDMRSIVKKDHLKAFNVQDASGNDVFVVDTIGGLIDVAGCQVVNGATPTASNHLATKGYVDDIARGLTLKSAVVAASFTGTNVNLLNPLASLDGVTLSVGDRVLLKDQTNAVQNGIYRVTTGNYLTRVDDLAVGSRASGVFTFVQQGTVNAERGFVATTDYPNDIVGTDAINFTQFTAGTTSVGDGLYVDGSNVISVSLDTVGSALSFNSGKLRVDPTIAGAGLTMTSGVIDLDTITSVGTITAGTWQGSTVAVGYGGTGNTSFSTGGVVFSNGTNLLGDSTNLYWDNTKKALGIATNAPNPNNQTEGLTMTKDIALYSTDASIFLGASGNYNWRIRRADAGAGAGHLVFSTGTSTSKGSLTDAVILTTGGNMGVGYAIGSVASITSTLDVSGTARITGDVTLSSSTASTSTTTGALKVAGGLGVAGTIYGANYSSPGTMTFTDTNGGIVWSGRYSFVQTSGASVRLIPATGSSFFAWRNTANTADTYTIDANGNVSTTGSITTSNATNSTALGTGALIASAGGLSVALNAHIGRTLRLHTAAFSDTVSSTGQLLSISAGTYTNSSTAASGVVTNWYGSFYGQPTVAATNASVTTTNSATLYIQGQPLAGTNQTLTNAFALQVAGGTSKFGGAVLLDDTTAIGNVNTSLPASVTFAGHVLMNNATSNMIAFRNVGIAAPAVTTRSAGTKLVLFPSLSGTSVDYAIGIESNNLWFSSTTSSTGFKWYSAATNTMTLAGDGQLSLTGNTRTTSSTNTNGANNFSFYKNRAGAAVQNSDELGWIGFYGLSDTLVDSRAAYIIARANAVPSGGAVPGRLDIFTRGAAGAEAVRMTISDAGINMNSQPVINVPTPTNGTDAANMTYTQSNPTTIANTRIAYSNGTNLTGTSDLTYDGAILAMGANNTYRTIRMGGGNSSGFMYGAFTQLGDGLHWGYNAYNNNTAWVINNAGGTTSRIRVGYGTITMFTGGTNAAPTTTRLNIDGPSNHVSIQNSTFEVQSTTGSTSTTTGALVVDGGAGIAENLFVGGTLTVGGKGVYASTGDIGETSFSAANNVVAATNVTGFAFSGAVRSFFAIVNVSVVKTSSAYNQFTLRGLRKATNNWVLYADAIGGDDTGITFSITTAGQVQYTSANHTGWTSTTIVFRAFAVS